jgi:hypothetical protein
MASTYSDLKIELIGTGDQTGTWGSTTNNNFSVAISEVITGSADVAFSSADVTLTLTDTNAAQTARNLRLNLTGTSGGARQLILGSGCQIEKLYLVNNGLADAVTVKNTTGTGISVAAGKSMFVFNNGTNVVDATTYLSSLTLGSALPVASGGTSLTTLTANNVILGNGTSTPSFVAPGTTGNVLTSNGTTWASTTPTAQTYPGAGIANSTGSAWGTSYTTSGTGTVVALATGAALNTPVVTNYTETLYAPAAGSSFTISLANGTVQELSLNGNGTITLPSSVAGKSFVIIVTYSGAYTVTWAGGSTIKWPSGTVPTSSSASGKFDIFTFFQDGTNTYGNSFGLNY